MDALGSPYSNIYKFTPKTGAKQHYYKVFPGNSATPTASIYVNQTGIQQKVEYEVQEDLFGDLFTTIYNRNENYDSLPSSLLTFDFSISPNLSSLFKTSNPNIGDVKVTIKSMELTFYTYNFGLLSIQPSTYYVPFYSEVTQNQKVNLTNSIIKDLNPIKLNKQPSYVLFYFSENIQGTINKNVSTALNTLKITDLTLKIDNDQGAALYGLNERQLKEMTLRNFGEFARNQEALFRRQKWIGSNVLEAFGLNNGNTPASKSPGDMTYKIMMKFFDSYVAGSLPLLDGVYLLKVGTDIRIDTLQIPSLNKPTVYQFTPTINNQNFNSYAEDGVATFNFTAFYPSYYVMNSETGLISTKDIAYGEDDMLKLIANSTQNIRAIQGQPNRQEYTTQSPNMLLGSGWFGGLNAGMKNYAMSQKF